MNSAFRRSKDLFSSREGLNLIETFGLSKNDADDSKFSIFRDYLGLINIVQPDSPCPSVTSSIDSPSESVDSMFNYPPYSHRHRINSLDSDGLSDSGSSHSGSTRNEDLASDSLSSSGEFLPFRPPQKSAAIPPEDVLPASYAASLESFLASQQSVVSQQIQQHVQQQVQSKALKNLNKASVCVFCRNNGESKEFYISHTLKDSDGNTTCPILRAYTCPLCKAHGNQSHTIKYCPKYTPKPKTDKLLGGIPLL